ncbi:MAG: beta-hydroxyacyl-ACP dehydratase [Puniceicoccales bacterium]|jgi:3-hydroxyacyl-[acyl-carrier-protein] dehydratase|nr:beta-hydroxyacyl-ACP dehydratase [Puniceicoccales bacterium]
MVNPEDLIPHRPPFLFLDKIIEIGDTNAIVQKTFSENDFFYKGHYPGYPITPGVILCEAVFQVAAYFAINKLTKESVAMENMVPVLAKINDARFRRSVFPGDTVILKAELLEFIGKFMIMQGSVFQDEKASVSVKFSIAFAGGE